MQDGPHRDLMLQAIAREARRIAPRWRATATSRRSAYGDAVALYRQSWELAPPKSYGRLVGLLKAAVLGGAGAQGAAYVRGQLAAEAAGEPSPTAGYVLAVAALIAGDDDAAVRFAGAMRGASEPHDRTADAITAIAHGDAAGYRDAVAAIVDGLRRARRAPHRRADRRHGGDARGHRARARPGRRAARPAAAGLERRRASTGASRRAVAGAARAAHRAEHRAHRRDDRVRGLAGAAPVTERLALGHVALDVDAVGRGEAVRT